MPVMIKALGYYSHKGTKGLLKVKTHLKYLEHGKIHENQPRGFDRERDLVKRNEFMQQIREQPERGVIAHKLVFSLSQDERDRLGVDLKDVVRDTMAAWESRLGRELHWIGFEHEDRGHPHVHVVVGGYAGDKQVGVFERDLKFLHETADRAKEVLARPLERESARELSPAKDSSRLLEQEQTRVNLLEKVLEMIFGREQEMERGWDRER